jgi:hypothetical protein
VRCQQHGKDGDADAERVERAAIEHERARHAKEGHVGDRAAKPVSRDHRPKRGDELWLGRGDQQHADSHEEQHCRRDVFDAANCGGNEALHGQRRARDEHPKERGNQECHRSI